MPALPNPEGTVEIFCSYSHKDEPLRQEFESSVALLRRQKLVQIWHDRQIPAGEDWAGDIDEHLNTADIITLFVSSDFLNSDYCYEKELTRALERQHQNDVLLVPIIVRQCDWTDAPFAKLQAVPTGAKAVTSWPNRDEAWTDVAKSLKDTVRKVLTRKVARLKAELNKKPPAHSFAVKHGSDSRAYEILSADRAEAEVIYAQIAKDAKERKAERLRIMSEMQAKIFAITAEIGPADPRPKKRVSEMDKYLKK